MSMASPPPSPADGIGRHWSDRARWHVVEIVFWVLAAASVLVLPGHGGLLTEIAILALFALSLDLILGYAGIVSIGHAAFFGVGAYAAGLLAKHWIADPLLGLLLAAVAASLLGFVTSFLVLRGGDLTRLMVTLGVLLALREIAGQMAWLTGGAAGLGNVAVAPIFGLLRLDPGGAVAYGYALAVLFLLFAVARRVVNSSFCLSLRAAQENFPRASALGIPVNRRLVAIYSVAAGYAGVAGAMFVQATGAVPPDVLSFERSSALLLVLLIGGAGYLYGGVIGAIVFTLAQHWLGGLPPQYWQFAIGAVLMLIGLIGHARVARWPALVQAISARLARSRLVGSGAVAPPGGER